MNPYQNPDIFIGNLRLQEPITTLTDMLFCFVCFIAFFKTAAQANNKAINLYRWFFLLTGISTLVAALVGHAFLYHFGAQAKIYGWALGIISISFSQFAALNHSAKTLGAKYYKALILLFSLETIIAFILTFVFWTFIVVEIHTAFCLLIAVVSLEYINYKKTKSTLSKNMILGVGILVIAVLCHLLKIAISKWFNHIDLSHIFMTISMYVMYLAVKNNSEKIKVINN